MRCYFISCIFVMFFIGGCSSSGSKPTLVLDFFSQEKSSIVWLNEEPVAVFASAPGLVLYEGHPLVEGHNCLRVEMANNAIVKDEFRISVSSEDKPVAISLKKTGGMYEAAFSVDGVSAAPDLGSVSRASENEARLITDAIVTALSVSDFGRLREMGLGDEYQDEILRGFAFEEGAGDEDILVVSGNSYMLVCSARREEGGSIVQEYRPLAKWSTENGSVMILRYFLFRVLKGNKLEIMLREGWHCIEGNIETSTDA